MKGVMFKVDYQQSLGKRGLRHFVTDTRRPGAFGGFTLVELMIVVAIIAIILSLALPTYSNYSVRAKIAEGIAVAKGAKTAVTAACQEDLTLDSLTNDLAGYSFQGSGDDEDYVSDIQVSGECSEPVITVDLVNTGLSFDPVLVITGDFPPGSGAVYWQCRSNNTPNHLLPDTCRS